MYDVVMVDPRGIEAEETHKPNITDFREACEHAEISSKFSSYRFVVRDDAGNAVGAYLRGKWVG